MKTKIDSPILREQIKTQLKEMIEKGELNELSLSSMFGGLGNLANKGKEAVVNKATDIKNQVVDTAEKMKTTYMQGALANEVKEVEAEFHKFAKTLNKFNQDCAKYNVPHLSLLALANKYGEEFKNLFKEEPIMESDDKWIQNIDMKKGKLKDKLGLKDGEKVTVSRIDTELKKLDNKYKEGEKMSNSDLTFSKELNLAKNLIKSKK